MPCPLGDAWQREGAVDGEGDSRGRCPQESLSHTADAWVGGGPPAAGLSLFLSGAQDLAPTAEAPSSLPQARLSAERPALCCVRSPASSVWRSRARPRAGEGPLKCTSPPGV